MCKLPCKIIYSICLARYGLAVILLLCGWDTVWAERKALVIGNAAYVENKLPNPIHDAEDIKTKLDDLGFTVVLIENANKKAMVEALNRFSQSLSPDDDAVFFYAGHGAQNNGRNYLIPLNAKITENTDLEYEAVDLGQVLGKLEHAQNGFKLAIIDACRNNPYTRSFRDGTRGLARVDAPSGTLVWYAAQPGKVAEDGKGRNGTFTQYLLQTLSQPGLDTDALFKRTAREVYQATAGRQFPYPEGISLVDFKFAEGIATPEPSAPSPAAVELSFWDSIKNSDKTDDFDEYLRQYPQGRFAGLARNRVKRLSHPVDNPEIDLQSNTAIPEYQNKRSQLLKITKVSSTPKVVNPGDTVSLSMDFIVTLSEGYDSIPITEKWTLEKDGKALAELPQVAGDIASGAWTGSAAIPIPRNAEAGNYVVEHRVESGTFSDVKESSFVVVAQQPQYTPVIDSYGDPNATRIEYDINACKELVSKLTGQDYVRGLNTCLRNRGHNVMN